MTLVLIDGHGLFHRAYHAGLPRREGDTPARRTASGEPTWAVYGFARWLLTTIAERKPTAMAVAFDVSRQSLLRRQRYAEYKAHRPAVPDDLACQIPWAKAFVTALGIPEYHLEGYEADDILGTLGSQAVAAGHQVEIVTGDRDLFQLVGGSLTVCLPRAKRQKGETFLEAYDAAGVFGRMGVRPEQIACLKGLAGDSSDNIPGVPGVGEKTALDLLAQFGSLAALYADDRDLFKKGLRAKLTAHRELAFLSHELATIDCAVPLTVDLADLRFKRPDMAAFESLLARLEFGELAREFGLVAV